MTAIKNQKAFIYGLLKKTVDTGRLSRQDHVKLSSMLLSPVALTPAERECVHHIFDEIELGAIQLIE